MGQYSPPFSAALAISRLILKQFSMPIVTIVTPVFNASPWLGEMLASVAAQTFDNWEQILVDDCSTDHSVALIERAAASDPRIRLLKLDSNRGPAFARNRALEVARGRYIAFLDADDLWLPEKLERCLEFMEQRQCSFVYHAFRYISADGRNLGAVVKGPSRLTFKTLHTRRGTGDCMSIVIDRTKAMDFRFFEVLRDCHEDWLAWRGLVLGGHVGFLLPSDLGRYRLSTGSRNADKITAAKKVWHLYREFERLPWLRAASWWLQYCWNSFWMRFHCRPQMHPNDGRGGFIGPRSRVRDAKRAHVAPVSE